MKTNNRDVGLKGGAGKGDAPRNMSKKFYENFDGIDFRFEHRLSVSDFADGFTRRGNKLKKVYQ